MLNNINNNFIIQSAWTEVCISCESDNQLHVYRYDLDQREMMRRILVKLLCDDALYQTKWSGPCHMHNTMYHILTT